MINFLKDNWLLLLVAVLIIAMTLTVMRASKREDSDAADSLDEETNEPVELNEYGYPKNNHRA